MTTTVPSLVQKSDPRDGACYSSHVDAVNKTGQLRSNVYELDPIQDPRWDAFVLDHRDGSIFHSSAWLDSLRRTYDYDPVVYTTTPPGQALTNGLVFCRVRSWLNGSRLVSVPFSDHCQPLVDDTETLLTLTASLQTSLVCEHWKYIEIRPLASQAPVFEVNRHFHRNEEFWFQTVDLRPDLDTLFQKFHKSCVQRKIRRAEREQLIYEQGRSEALLQKFYALLILTRRRHGIPPQPLSWFRNLIACLGDNVLIRLASKGNQPVASIITIAFKKSLVYKYGCSDARFHNLGGTPLLFWKAIQDAKHDGMIEYDLGRSDLDNPGLISFKENWGATNSPLIYYRLSAAYRSGEFPKIFSRVAKTVFSRMPESLLIASGRLLYRHTG
jgi:CelD/BcsL family acetyltransferase involved in cellulose biosynthesis